MVKIGGNILDAIGNTSLVNLGRVVPPGPAKIFAKLEWENPAGSMKDSTAQAMIPRAEAEGRLKKGDQIVEYPSDGEGLFPGTSSGANVVAAIKAAGRLGQHARIATLMADSGLKYLSRDLYKR